MMIDASQLRGGADSMLGALVGRLVMALNRVLDGALW
jgi:hypothetical protein